MKSIIQFIGLFFLLLLSFFGSNYMLDGDIFISASISIVLAVLMYFLVEELTKRKEEIKKSRFSMVWIILSFVYLFLSAPTVILVTHALNAEINAKPQLQSYAIEISSSNAEHIEFFRNRNQQYIRETGLIARNALDTYVHTRDRNVKDSIKNLLASSRFKINDLSNVSRSNFQNESNALVEVLNVKHDLLIDSVKSKSNFVETSQLHLVQNWSRLHVVVALNELENMRNENLTQLSNSLQRSGIDSTFNDAFDYVVEDNNRTIVEEFPVDISSFFNLRKRYKPFWLLIPSLMLTIFLSLPYFLTKTQGVYVSKKDKEKKGGISITK